jgi:DNA-binding MarR family transcriptional regulator
MVSQQNSLGFLIADVSRLLRRAFQQRLEGSSLTLAQARALVYVSHHEGIRQVDLADMLEIQPITLARLLDQLVETGLVERRPAPHDRRAYQIFLTDAAEPHLLAIEQVAASIRADILSDLSEAQVSAFMGTLGMIRSKLIAN